MYCCKENLKSIIESANTNLNMAYAAYVLQLLNEPMKEFATKLKEVGKTTKSLTVRLTFRHFSVGSSPNF